MTIYDDLRVIASEVLAEFQQGSVTLVRRTYGVPDPQTPWTPGDVTETTEYTLAAVVRGVKKQHVDGTLILASDLMVTCNADLVEPLMSDVLKIDGVPHAIRRIEPIPAAGTA